jgi:hypothetical protein
MQRVGHVRQGLLQTEKDLLVLPRRADGPKQCHCGESEQSPSNGTAAYRTPSVRTLCSVLHARTPSIHQHRSHHELVYLFLLTSPNKIIDKGSQTTTQWHPDALTHPWSPPPSVRQPSLPCTLLIPSIPRRWSTHNLSSTQSFPVILDMLSGGKKPSTC